ncbi:MAG: ATP-binding protein [Atopobium sp.]|uniref:ATP-binding protein n=1 Tax=Atopobium sp. TaxID=1872650 RepID=UPI002A763579|nr:ATP-binding protein [Atopobium sp.]MDY2787929.1 ATP-binding protein [Atopobium sp.]
MPTNSVCVPKRIAGVLINSLKGGVVPRVGLPYITVGRKDEIAALLRDLSMVADGGASCRFVVGRYGSGKSFLLQTMRNHAMGNNFVVADADLSPERRLQGTRGQGLATYRELISNLSTKTRPEGGALTLILDRWVTTAQSKVIAAGVLPEDARFVDEVQKEIYASLVDLQELVHGFDFAKLLSSYFRAYMDGDDELKAHVIRWFRGEYRTKSEARAELGVTAIITDDDWYDYLKLFARFLRGAGYEGLLILIDELVNLYKIPHAVSRQYNYEKLLTIYNDALQGRAQYLGIIMGGTPQTVEDRRRGLYSYEALRSRLTQGRFGREGMSDLLAPVIRLTALTPEELLVLIEKLADIHAGLFEYDRRLNEAQLTRFLEVELSRVGAQTHITPREVIRDFIELLDIMFQDPTVTIESLLADRSFGQHGFLEATTSGDSGSSDSGGSCGTSDEASGFAEFTI